MTDRRPPEEVSAFWAANPMTYAERHGTLAYRDSAGRRREIEIGSREFFDAADAVFYSWNRPRHSAGIPFANIFDYARYAGKPVLEVGCGMGCMAMNWARQGARVVAVDLNPVAVAQTRRRFEIMDLQGAIQQADARQLPFGDDRFAYAYSWGVLHHSPEIERSIAEIRRVLAPGGRMGVMLYHRRALTYLYGAAWMQGVIHLENRFLSPLAFASRYGDGWVDEGNPHTWPVTKREAKTLFSAFEDVRIEVFGTELDTAIDTLLPRMSDVLPVAARQALARRWGWSLWITGAKPG